MAGPIQSAMSQVVNLASGVAVAGKKISEDKKQASEKQKLEMEAKAKAQKAEADAIQQKKQAEEEKALALQKKVEAMQTEGKQVALEADLIKMGADPKTARAFMNARELGLDTKGFGMLRNKGKFAGSYATMAERLSKDALVDTLSSRAINEAGFAERLYSLANTRKGRVEALVEASKGGKK